MKPKFRLEPEHFVDGIKCRYTPGNRFKGDICIEIETAEGWKRPSMELLLRCFDLYAQNDDVRYPRVRGYLGGKMIYNAVKTAYKHGWLVACEEWVWRRKS